MSPLLKVAIPAAAIILIIARIRRSARPDAFYGLTKPPVGATIAWVAVMLLWVVGSDLITNWRGPFDFAPWRAAPLWADACRVIGVGLLGPIAEELIFRGLAFSWIEEKAGPVTAVVLTAAVWAVVHPYAWWIDGLIFVQGILLGTARWRTRSIVPSCLMHIATNLYAVW